MWLFKKHNNIRLIWCLYGLLFLTASCQASSPDLKSKAYIILQETDDGQKWAEYLYQHLRKRAQEDMSVMLLTGKVKPPVRDDSKIISLKVTPGLNDDYKISHTKNWLDISVRDDRTALWMVYQLIENIAATDARFTAEDLPPAVIDMGDKKGNFDFQYREPFWEPNLQQYYAAVSGTNNMETDWGIWGHNLSKVLADVKDEQIQALINHRRNPLQFCFSSPQLLKDVTAYISDNFGEGDKQGYRFMIMPQDNNLVCSCPRCLQLGNKAGNATPAVTWLTRKLAERFPKHQFFITAYKTTAVPPNSVLPENTGVFISTMNLPKGIALNRNQTATRNFINNVAAWQAVTPHIYLWDYAANFDDYLSPLPVLSGLQKQLQFFKSLGVQGVFLNAAGYEYSSFQGVQAFVAGALMMDTKADLPALVKKYFKKEYPVSHRLLSDYYLSLENSFSSGNKAYDIYGGIQESLDTYLDPHTFITFYNALKGAVDQTSGSEHQKLQKLFTALSFTRLQIAYALGSKEGGYAKAQGNALVVKPEVDAFMKVLSRFKDYPDMKQYRETGGALSDYLSEWSRIRSHERYENLLMGKPLRVLSKTDELFKTPQLLRDGTPGFEEDYHQGWYLSSHDNLTVRFDAQEADSAKEIRLRFLNDPEHGIFPPEKVVLLVDGKEQEGSPVKLSENITLYTLPVNFATAQSVTLNCIRKKAARSAIACDEIRVLK